MERLFEVLFTEVSEWPGVALFEFQKLWDFLYEEEIEGWFLEQIKSIEHVRQFRDVVLGLHTDSTITAKTLPPALRQQIAQKLLWQLTVAVLKFCGPDLDNPTAEQTDELILTRALLRQLEIDGYVYRNEKLYPSESTVIPEEAERSYLERLIQDSRLSDSETIIHHLRLSEEHFLEGRWDDSISNSRKVLDAILNQIASAVYLKLNSNPIPSQMLRNATDIRLFLERQNIVTRVEREALDKNYGALSATGGHPYIAEKDQARLMRHLALTFSQFVVLRFEGFVRNNP